MMKEVVFATNNIHKLREIRNIVENSGKANLHKLQILSLKDIGCNEELEETGDTLEANASQKAFYIYNNYKINCFADDTGLEINTLNGKPGVYSARYAGSSKSFDDNINKVLEELNGISDRDACFRTVISLIIEGKEYLFEGRINGTIISEKRGSNGFGYDPVFIPDGHKRTFAEMTDDEKNSLSHRFIAMNKMIKSGLFK
jgi:XTP/dITP diphosphohydrolase